MTTHNNILKVAVLCLLTVLSLPLSAQRFGALNQVLDLGQVSFNRPITAEFDLVNKADRAIVITHAHSSCGCTTVDYPQGHIARGQRFVVSATYDARQLGHFHKQVSLFVDGEDDPVVLTLKGIVVDKIINYTGKYDYKLGNLSADKTAITFDDVNAGDQPTAKIHIINPTQKAAQPVVMHLPAYLTAEVSPSKLAPGQAGTVTLTLCSEELGNYGLTQTNIYLGMNPGERVSPDKGIAVSTVLLPSFADLTEADLATAPRLTLSEGDSNNLQLNLGSLKGKKKAKGAINVTNSGQSELEISSLQMFVPGLQLALNKSHLAPGESATLHITAIAKELQRARQQPRILMITNDPKRPKVTIDIITE